MASPTLGDSLACVSVYLLQLAEEFPGVKSRENNLLGSAVGSSPKIPLRRVPILSWIIVAIANWLFMGTSYRRYQKLIDGAYLHKRRAVPPAVLSPELQDRFEPAFSMAGAISQHRERCQFLFFLRNNQRSYRVTGGERSGRATIFYRAARRSHSERFDGLALASGFHSSDIVQYIT